MATFGELNSAARFKETVRKIATGVYYEINPRSRRGTVTAIDVAKQIVYVKYPDEAASFPVHSGPIMPDPTAVVRVGGPNGARRVEEILSGPVRFASPVSGVDGSGNGTPGTNGIDGKTILNGLAPPDNSMGVDGDFFIETDAWLIYGPKEAGIWPAGVSIIGPPGQDGQDGTGGTSTSDALAVIHKLRTTSATKTNTATPTADDVLTVSLPANSTWMFEITLKFTGADAADARVDFDAPAGATGSYQLLGVATAATSSTGTSITFRGAASSFTTDFTSATLASATAPVTGSGHLVVTTAGTFAVRWAQSVADAANIVLEAGSWMRLTRLA